MNEFGLLRMYLNLKARTTRQDIMNNSILKFGTNEALNDQIDRKARSLRFRWEKRNQGH